MYRMLIIIVLCTLFTDCKNNDTAETNQLDSVESTTEQIIDQSQPQLEETPQVTGTSAELTTYFSKETITAVQDLKKRFEEGLAGGSSYTNIGQLYKLHAQRMRIDMLEKFPFVKNYPYNQEKKIIQSEDIIKLPFLTDACGYLINDTEKVNFPCFTKDNSLFTYLQSASRANALIKGIIAEYQSALGMTPSIQQSLLMDSIDQLNFDRYADQLFYALFHIVLNEEWVISQGLKAKSELSSE